MIIQLDFNKKKYKADLNHPLDVSLPLQEGSENVNCYWADPIKFETISSGDFIGSVKAGGSVNYQKLSLTPHGNGTHTECYGHISADSSATINHCLTNFHFICEVLSLPVETLANGDQVITHKVFLEKVKYPQAEAVALRTLPNKNSKKLTQYSGTNPPYLEAAITEYLASRNVLHLLIDLPSVDREVDEGKLLAHKAFWQFPDNIRTQSTITELIYIDDSIPDGLYLVNLQIASLEMDASPSKPVLYKLEEVS